MRKPLGAVQLRTPSAALVGWTSSHVPVAPVSRPLAFVVGAPEIRIVALPEVLTVKVMALPRAIVAAGPEYSKGAAALAAAGTASARARTDIRTRRIVRWIGASGAALGCAR